MHGMVTIWTAWLGLHYLEYLDSTKCSNRRRSSGFVVVVPIAVRCAVYYNHNVVSGENNVLLYVRHPSVELVHRLEPN